MAVAASQPWLCSGPVLRACLGPPHVTLGNNVCPDTFRAEPPPNGESDSRLGGFEASCAHWDLYQGWAPARRVDGLVWKQEFQRTDAESPAQACPETVVPFSTEGQRSGWGKFIRTLSVSLNSDSVEID